MKRAGLFSDVFFFLWSPRPQAGAIILAVAGTLPIFATAHLAPAVLGLPLVLGISSIVVWASSSLVASPALTRLDAVRRFSNPTSSKSIYDLETGFCSEWYFLLRVEQEVIRTKRSGQTLGLLLVESQGSLGPTLRNHLLLSLERTFRTVDLVGRLDDSRFGVLLVDCSREGAGEARERLVQLVGQQTIRVEHAVYPNGEVEWRKFLAGGGSDPHFPAAEPIWGQDRSSRFDREMETAALPGIQSTVRTFRSRISR